MTNTTRIRPDRDEYFMGIAMAVRRRANCLGNRVGAALVVEDRLVSAGYNGVPEDMTNCEQGGCDRCDKREKYGSGKGYDVCICVHAEQNALLSSARLGIPVAEAVLYCTMRPCSGCTKELLQAKIKAVYYLHGWKHPDAELNAEYERLQTRFPEGIRHLDMEDPEREWAVSANRPTSQETGHSTPQQLGGHYT